MSSAGERDITHAGIRGWTEALCGWHLPVTVELLSQLRKRYAPPWRVKLRLPPGQRQLWCRTRRQQSVVVARISKQPDGGPLCAACHYGATR